MIQLQLDLITIPFGPLFLMLDSSIVNLTGPAGSLSPLIFCFAKKKAIGTLLRDFSYVGKTSLLQLAAVPLQLVAMAIDRCQKGKNLVGKTLRNITYRVRTYVFTLFYIVAGFTS